MFGGGGGLDPRKMQQMMEQMGIDVTEIDAEEILIRTPEEELVFEEADVQRMDAQGQATYQIVGEPETRPRGAANASEKGETSGADAGAGGGEAGGEAADIPDTDVEIVAGRTGASEEEAREALAETDGDLAAAVERLE
jgi:nascent polypeptide-associated complex subunit alpha